MIANKIVVIFTLIPLIDIEASLAGYFIKHFFPSNNFDVICFGVFYYSKCFPLFGNHHIFYGSAF